ncbi:josephin-like protein [Cornus florida]|uniref:josephin-like protein n=1 Tax=Cornus florida TaxID=4283 RepID=UPI0028A2869C|nr:josephin-like protein [Cornus florida]
MLRKMSKRVGFSPDVNEKPTCLHKHGGGRGKVAVNRKRVIGIWSFRLPRSSSFAPVGFLKRIAAKVARALQLVSTRKRSSCKVSSSSMSSSLARSRSYADQIDSHRAEAIEDCIEFLNSSSSLQRSNSVSSSC